METVGLSRLRGDMIFAIFNNDGFYYAKLKKMNTLI